MSTTEKLEQGLQETNTLLAKIVLIKTGKIKNKRQFEALRLSQEQVQSIIDEYLAKTPVKIVPNQ
jgi:hypothetical protein